MTTARSLADTLRSFGDETLTVRNGMLYARSAGLPVILNPDDDIYYSTEELISFKITPVSRFESVCSMVWDPIESNAQSIATLRSVDPTATLRDNNDGTITAFHYGAP